MGSRRFVPTVSLVALALAACGGSVGDAPTRGDASSAAPEDAAAPRPDTGLPLAPDAARPADAGPGDAGPPDGGAEPEAAARDCVWRATDFGAPLRELDVAPDSAERLVFEVPGLPDPARIERATLRFVSYDADHPGEEGTVVVNGGGPRDLPADASWDNASGSGALDVRGALVAGTNRVVFGPGPLPRSFFRIGDVEIAGRARVASCESAPPPPPPEAVERRLHFSEASYTDRRTWVVPCPPGHPRHNVLRNYAFTARGDEHVETDCDGGYRPGGDRTGEAIFRFEGVVPARYRVVIRSRHTENRNPAGALFVVNGEGRRIDQTTSSDYEDDVWGEARLEGTVEVVLDSTREANSDCVTEVRLVPIGS